MDREAVEGYISRLGRGVPLGSLSDGENGVHDDEGGLPGEESEAASVDACVPEGVSEGGHEGGVDATHEVGEVVERAGSRGEAEAFSPSESVEIGHVSGAVNGERAVGEAVVTPVEEVVVIPQVVGESGELDMGDDGAGGPGLPDYLNDMGEKVVEEKDRFGTEPLPKWYRHSGDGGDNG